MFKIPNCRLVLLLLLICPAVVQAQDAYSTNADGSVYTYSTNTDGSANIVAYAGPGYIGDVTIPTHVNNGLTVTTIGNGAFFYDYHLFSVTIPNSVTSLGDSAFEECSSLTSVTIPNSVISIGDNAFAYCGLPSVTIPNSVISIGTNVFANSGGLTNITVDASNPVYSSMNGVLFDKAQATLLQFPERLGGSYTIPNSVTSIGDYAFENCFTLTNVTIPNSVTTIGTGAFLDCTILTSVTIPNSVTSIGTNAFAYCESLTNVTVPTSVINIGDGAFGGCSSLTGVTIGLGVTRIGGDAFGGCDSLTNITVDAANPAYSSLNGVLFDKAKATLLEFPVGLGGSYTIPNSVTSLGVDAFFGCYNLASVTIPNSVTNIGPNAFEDCQFLASVTIPNSVITIGDLAFFNCSSLTSVTIGHGVTRIGTNAFAYCQSLKSVTIPNSVSSIGDSAFSDCSSLKIVTIPNSVISIGDLAFLDCSSLTSVTIGHGVTSIGNNVFEYCNGLTSIIVDAANPAYSSLNGVLFDKAQATLLQFPEGLGGSYTIPTSVSSIGPDAFASCQSLTGIYFQGNSPSPTNDSTVFYGDPATVYYLPGTTGWGAMFDGLPTAPWFLLNPQILNHSASFGVQPGGFGFTISWATNVSVVVQAATNLANPVWIPVSTNTLTGGTSYFSDPQWTNYPGRFYRLRSP